ncbi:MAG: FMN-binding protein [Treponemataceae bacterium]|nr:MAG: FMN-binding protein [Treponemataceae bacterium]
MKDMLKLGAALAAYCVVACALLALVNNVTKPIIDAADAEALKNGQLEVFAAADDFQSVDKDGYTIPAGSKTKIKSFALAQKGGTVIGAVIQATGATYGTATILIGVNADKTLTQIKFMSIDDTPGFGQKATESTFYGQFEGMDVSGVVAVKKDGGSIDAITGATITSRGVAAIVKDASAVANAYFDANGIKGE